MVAIGRALMARPKLVLLDEPSLGLAPLRMAPRGPAGAPGASRVFPQPSYLLALLERGVRMLRRTLVAAEPLPPSLRAKLECNGVEIFQAYGTAEFGLLGYECSPRDGMHLDEAVKAVTRRTWE